MFPKLHISIDVMLEIVHTTGIDDDCVILDVCEESERLGVVLSHRLQIAQIWTCIVFLDHVQNLHIHAVRARS